MKKSEEEYKQTTIVVVKQSGRSSGSRYRRIKYIKKIPKQNTTPAYTKAPIITVVHSMISFRWPEANNNGNRSI